MRPIGGEIELKNHDANIFWTDSGRSSLRLFLRSGYRNKTFLLPDFLCSIIPKVLKEEGVHYMYYHVNEDLSIDVNSINSDFDVFYAINYFGQKLNLEKINLKNKILVEDNVFFYDFDNYLKHQNWFSFNSFRKISALSDGSLIKTNLKLDTLFINRNEAEFSSIKYIAKSIKFNFLNERNLKESEYLQLFKKGEMLIDEQKDIYFISNRSIYEILHININLFNNIQKRNFERFLVEFSEYCINKNPTNYSFFVMKIKNRVEFRNYLFGKNIYLPIHWPYHEVANSLYNKVISIPCFLNYKEEEISYIIDAIKYFLVKYS